MTQRTDAAMREVLAGRPRPFAPLLFVGPAVIASIAYMDPGNFATNIQAGARYGYALLWVVVTANVIAMLFQALSAKLGIVTGRNLAELCRDAFPTPMVWAMWAVSELAAMATDLAEFLGGAIGLAILFHVPLLAGMGVTALVTYGLLLLDKRGFRPLELGIGALVLVIGLCYLVELVIAPVAWGAAATGAVIPHIPDADALTIAVGIVGATVMPHAIYLHSGLTQARLKTPTMAERRLLVRYSNREVVVALAFAGMVNMAMVMMAAAAFHLGHGDVADIRKAYATLTPLLGAGAAVVFLVSLIASGVSSSVVGTMAGQMIMQGFVGFAVPIWVRRLVTMVPAFVVVAIGVDETRALVLSQVVLSLALPVPMLAVVWFTGRRALMGEFVNTRPMTVMAVIAAVLVLALNIILLLQAAGLVIPATGPALSLSPAHHEAGRASLAARRGTSARQAVAGQPRSCRRA